MGLHFGFVFYTKVCVAYSDLLNFVVGCAWLLIDQGQRVAVIRKTECKSIGCLLDLLLWTNRSERPG